MDTGSSFSLVYWGLTPQQQPGSYQGGEMMMKSVFWWKYPEETTDLRQVTDETFHTYGLCPVRGLNLGRSGVKQSELRRDESGALAHRATAVFRWYSQDMFRSFGVQKTSVRVTRYSLLLLQLHRQGLVLTS